jgi:hypothetical protein
VVKVVAVTVHKAELKARRVQPTLVAVVAVALTGNTPHQD